MGMAAATVGGGHRARMVRGIRALAAAGAPCMGVAVAAALRTRCGGSAAVSGRPSGRVGTMGTARGARHRWRRTALRTSLPWAPTPTIVAGPMPAGLATSAAHWGSAAARSVAAAARRASVAAARRASAAAARWAAAAARWVTPAASAVHRAARCAMAAGTRSETCRAVRSGARCGAPSGNPPAALCGAPGGARHGVRLGMACGAVRRASHLRGSREGWTPTPFAVC